VGAVADIAERLIAVEAQHAADLAGLVIVINMLRIRLVTDRTHPALRSQHPVDIWLANAVPPPKVVFAAAAVEALAGLAPSCVVAFLAIRRATKQSGSVTRNSPSIFTAPQSDTICGRPAQ
jgi:hypothetical protein